LERRGFFSDAFNDIKNVVTGAADDVGDAVDDAVSAVESVATEAASAVVNVATQVASAIVSVATEAASAVVNVATEAASAAVAVATDVAGAVESLNDFNETKSFDVQLANFNKDFVLINKTLGCGGNFSADLDISGTAFANISASAGIVAVGTIVPPNLSQFQTVFGGNADFNGSLSAHVGVEGPFSTSVITLVQPIGLTPFQIPGILILGPSIELTGQVTGDLNLVVDLEATLSFSANNLQIFFPPQAGQTSSSDTTLNDSPFSLSADPSIEGSGSAELHLTPTLQLGLNAFMNKVQADVFVDLDVGVQFNATNLDSGVFAAANGSDSFSGDIDISIPLSINVGANGDFFGLLKGRDQLQVFEHTFNVFSKSFGNPSSKRSIDTHTFSSFLSPYIPLSSIRKREETRRAERADLVSGYHKRGPFAILAERQDAVTCPPAPATNVTEVASGVASNATDSSQ